MSTPGKKQSNVIPILSLLLLAFPVYLLLRWVYVFNTMSTHVERVAAFGDHMKATLITLIATASAVTAVLFGLSGLLLLAGLRSVICGVAALAGLLLPLWFVWTLL